MRWNLPPGQMPEAWFNVVPQLPEPLQPDLHPGTRQPLGPDDLAPLFPMALIGQEVTSEPWVDIPGEVIDVLRLWRPTPLVRAERLEQAPWTPRPASTTRTSRSRPPGPTSRTPPSPRPTTTSRQGIERLATETGAGQWGSALAFACALFGLECKVYMVRASYDQKPYRRVMMEIWGGSVVPSPVDDPDSPGSLGSAISDAVRDAVSREDTHYSLGSVLNHVLLHQTVIGLEAKDQLHTAGERLPDLVIGSCGGGSNLGGISLPFVPDAGVDLLAVEPSSCPTLTEGTFEYDFADVAEMTPLLPMYSLGHEFMPPSIHAGGCATTATPRSSPCSSRPAGCGRSPIHRARSSRRPSSSPGPRGRIPAPETAHAIRAVIDEALAAKEAGRGKGDPLLATPATGSWTSAPTTTTCTGGSTEADRRAQLSTPAETGWRPSVRRPRRG